MFRAACICDLHFRPGAGLAEPARIHDWIAADIEQRAARGEQIDAIFLGGDLHHTASRPDDRKAIATLCVRLAALAPVVIAYGNHDRPGDLDLLPALASRHPIAVFAEPGVWRHPSGVGAVAVVPWVNNLAPTWQRGKTALELAANVRAARATMFDALGAELASAPGAHLFLGHCMLDGAVPGIGQPERAGAEFIVELEDLDRIPASIFLLGHVHTAQSWTSFKNNRQVLYVGAPYRTAFGEVEQKHYVLATVRSSDDVEVERVATPATPMVHVEDAWELGEGAGDPGWARDSAQGALGSVIGADVRFTYSTPASSRKQAREAAEKVRRALLDAGARKVKLDGRVEAEVRVKVAGITQAKTAAEKFAVYLTTLTTPPAVPIIDRAKELLTALPSDLTTATLGTGGMRLRRITLTAFKPFPEGIDLDIDAIPGDIIAVRGENGEGKSTLFGAWPGVLYGKMPSGAALDAFALGEEAQAEVTVDVDGESWTLQQHPSRGQAFALSPSLAPIDKRGGIRSFKAWREEHIIPSALSYGSIFSPQKSNGVIGMGATDRKRTFVAALGGERLEVIAKTARAKVITAREGLRELGPLLDDHEARFRAIPVDLAARLDVARAAVTAATSALEHGEAEQKTRLERRRLVDDLEQARRECDRIQRRIDADQELLSQAETIRAAAARLSEITTLLGEKRGERTTATRDRARLDQEHGILFASARTAQGNAARFTAEIAKIDAALKDKPVLHMITDADARTRQATGDLQVNMGNLEAWQGRLVIAQGEQQKAIEERIASLRNTMDAAMKEKTIASARRVLRQALSDDDELRARNADGLQEIIDRVAVEQNLIAKARQQIAEFSPLASQLQEVQALHHQRLALTEQHQQCVESHRTTEQESASKGAEIARLDALNCALFEEINRLEKEAANHAPIARSLDALTRAETTKDALAPSLAAASAKVDAMEALLAKIPAPPTPDPNVPALRDALRAAERTMTTLDTQAGGRDALEITLSRMRGEKKQLELDRDAWTLLDRAFGANGIQALEIDAAGPELTTTINDLLHGCFGNRWTIRIDTSRVGGKGQDVGACPILVWDGEKEDEQPRDASEFSEGQQATLGRAISLGLATIICARADAHHPTLVLDETGAGVSEENVEPFMTLLRRAAQAIGAGKVFLITHSDAMTALCDTVLTVAGGKVAVAPR